ncbi:hypothetical protein KOW79_018600 [Hemibagrus wyckioides]|uniref:arylamine N-acetyltransferase n=1 Tax=Hemibagrus wyckioides TaxID=337641 RepID=A0A9D3NAL1_9TELE|nr:hypothetical protein KOW79_018600 [Hemibagrus wyckioides]
MDVQKYLSRIGCSVCPHSPTLDTLRFLHLQHMLSVPFENLTIHTGQRVHLELPLLYDKIVLKRRGGFCFENNGLFSWLLSQLGFKVEILSAQLPLSLETDRTQTQGQGVYRVRADGNLLFMETKSESDDGASWVEMYKFTLQPCQREDFTVMCEYHQTSSSSIFFCKSLCTLLLPDGRVTLMGRNLIITHLTGENGPPVKTTKTDLTNEEILQILREKFGIVLMSPLITKDTDIVPPSVEY